MAYDEALAERVRELIVGRVVAVEKAMFGGLSFMVNGNMSCGVIGEELVVRVGKERHESALARPYARVMDLTGRPMKGWIYISTEGVESEAGLTEWVELGLEYALSLPAK